MAPKIKGVKNLEKKTIEHYKGRFLNTHKVPFMFFFLLLMFQHDL
jgi:K+-transporting ATPase A subunit